MNVLLDTKPLKRWSVSLALLLFLFASVAKATDRVLILGDTVSGGMSSIEAKEAIKLGFAVDVATVGTWPKTLADFQQYRAIILGDPLCKGITAVATAAANATTWGKAVNGNVIIVGTDPVVHAANGGELLTQKAVDFATAQKDPSKKTTGAYISLSCYYESANPGTPVPLLDDAFGSGSGSFQVRSASCFNEAYITATSPALAGLTSSALSDWHCSVHEQFDAWPLDFVVLAIAKNSGSSYTAPDGTVGGPYILARGDISVLSDITLSPSSATNEIGNNHTFTATVKSLTGNALPGVTVTFKIIAGPNVGITTTAVTDASGNATFTYASTKIGADSIEAQFVNADGGTETSNIAAKTWVETVKSCMRLFADSTLCETDPTTGKPTGNYVWQFRFQNMSGRNVSHLFLVDLPPGVTVDQDHFVFTPSVSTSSLPIKVTLKGAKPGPVSFKVVLLDESLDECCSITVSLNLLPCDCAQVVSDKPPGCLDPISPPFRYSFTLQNLSPIQAQYVLVAPVSTSDHVTPIPPDQLAVTPDVFAIPLLDTGKKSAVLPLVFSGPQAVGGKNACVLLSIHDASLDNCCSIVRCVPLPNCFFRIDTVPLGSASITAAGAGFLVEGIGSSGEDGVGINPHDADAVGLGWLPLDVAGPLANGAFFEVTAGKAGQTMGKLRVTQAAASQYQVSTTIAGASTYSVEVFNGDQAVGTVGKQRGFNTNIVVIWPVAAGAEVVIPEPNDTGTLAFTLDAGRPVPWQFADGTTLTGDRIRITPEQVPVDLESIETFELRAAKIPSITVIAVSVSHDCNGNGIPDAEDIASGTSTDLDGNGIPDECQGPGQTDLNLSLATGFNQATGTALPAGSADDDWQVTNASPPGPAKVVIHPAPAWPTAFAGSEWISLEPNTGRSTHGLSTLRFEDCFCVSGNAAAAQLDFQLRADDIATVFLNGSRIGGPGGSFSSASPLHVNFNGAVGGTGPFRAGQNCLDVEVNDSGGGATGLNLAGTVTAANGVCSAAEAATNH
jgi:Bacterial Ig-like domain (group 1)